MIRHRCFGLVLAPALCLALLALATPARASYLPGDVMFGYGYHETGVNDEDGGLAIAVDGSGDAVATGYYAASASHYSLWGISLDPLADINWDYSYAGIDSRGDAVALDGAGNSYAVGWMAVAGHGHDMVLQATTVGGIAMGTKGYDGPAHKDDEAMAVTVDPDGTCYLTGMSKSAHHNYDIVTIKYGPAGDRQWVRRFNNPGNGFDGGFAIAHRGSALYVAGISHRPGHGDDAVLLRYDAAGGALKWVRYYDDALHRNESVSRVLATSSGVYVCGSGKNPMVLGGDALLLRYAGTGALKWAKYYGGSAGGQDGWEDIAAAPGGRIDVTGFVWHNATGDDVATASYTSSGTRRWLKWFSTAGSGLDSGAAIAVDAGTGLIYVAGSAERTVTGEDALAICYNAAGATQWHTFWDGGAGGGDDSVTDMALAPGCLWMTGQTTGATTGSDILMLQIAR